MEETKDVQPVEETTPSPSEETKPAIEETKEQNVPLERFREVVAERNQYKDLLAAKDQPAAEPNNDLSGDVDALKIIDSRSEQIINKKLEAMQRQMDLDKTIAANPDFFKYADLIKTKIQDNPHLSWADAYKLSRYDANLMQAKEQGKKEAYQNIEAKKAAAVEPAGKNVTGIPSNDAIDPLAKGPDGKFLFSRKELEEILPKK